MNNFLFSKFKFPIILIFVFIGSYFIVTSSFFTRMLADDFCVATVNKNFGFWGAQKFWWDTWSGRYSFNFIIHLASSFGTWVVKIIPILLYLGLIFSILPAFLISFKNRINAFLESVLISAFLILVIFINAPNIIQSL